MVLQKWSKAIWGSPTFTEWGVKLIQPLRLLLVTPLLLTQFSEPEIAAWFLFASINVLGAIFMGRINLTFSRMVSMAMGGARDLSPIMKVKQSEDDKEPNWLGIHQVYRCLGLLQFLSNLASVLVASLIGWFTLRSLSGSPEELRQIFIAFVIMQGSTLVIGSFGYISAMLRGLGHVALTNRWDSLTQIASLIGGIVVLSYGGGIVSLSITMQVVMASIVLRNIWLIRTVNDGRFRKAGGRRWDSQVWYWSWTPLWRGFVGQLASQGVLQVSALIFSFHSDTASLASFLFSMTMIRAIQHMAMTPFTSQQPKFSRLMGAGKTVELRGYLGRRIMVCQLLLLAGIVFTALVGPWVLDLIGAKANLLGVGPWLTLGSFFLYSSFNMYNLAVCATANNMQMHFEMAIAGGVSLGLLWVTIPVFGVWGIILSLWLPPLVILNWQAPRLAATQLDCRVWTWLKCQFRLNLISGLQEVK